MSLCTREIVARGRLPAEDVYAIFDGNTTPPPGGAGGGLEHLALQSWIKGDAHVYPCALASVLAKVADSHGTDPGPWLTVHGCWCALLTPPPFSSPLLPPPLISSSHLLLSYNHHR